MDQDIRIEKAALFRRQHLSKKLLILPNCWDALSARLLETIGFPSVATASVATALINGYADGEKIPLITLLKLIGEITAAVNVPVTVDLERGYSTSLEELSENIKALINLGVVGLNIEDSLEGGNGLTDVSEQCRKIETIKTTAIQCGVPIVINARTDIFLQNTTDQEVTQEAILRIKAFQNAGADCAYPIFISSYETIEVLVKETNMPLNVLLLKAVSDLKRLEEIGVSRVSVGPGLIKAALTKMKDSAISLMNYDSKEFFQDEFISNDFIKSLIRN